MIRRLLLEGAAEARGRRHGAAHAAGIRDYVEERVALVAGGMWSGGTASRTHVLEIAESMVDAHEAYDADLTAEMLSMAEAAGISPAEAVIVGGFTDFVDTIRAELGAAPEEDTCTAVIVPGAASVDGTGLYGQTWDMHDTATQHIVLLDIRPESGPAALVFSTVGCVGQMGMNEAGICIGIARPRSTPPSLASSMLSWRVPTTSCWWMRRDAVSTSKRCRKGRSSPR
jgi:isopenicillin-N N-acyltransferase-like protein